MLRFYLAGLSSSARLDGLPLRSVLLVSPVSLCTNGARPWGCRNSGVCGGHQAKAGSARCPHGDGPLELPRSAKPLVLGRAWDVPGQAPVLDVTTYGVWTVLLAFLLRPHSQLSCPVGGQISRCFREMVPLPQSLLATSSVLIRKERGSSCKFTDSAKKPCPLTPDAHDKALREAKQVTRCVQFWLFVFRPAQRPSTRPSQSPCLVAPIIATLLRWLLSASRLFRWPRICSRGGRGVSGLLGFGLVRLRSSLDLLQAAQRARPEAYDCPLLWSRGMAFLHEHQKTPNQDTEILLSQPIPWTSQASRCEAFRG